MATHPRIKQIQAASQEILGEKPAYTNTRIEQIKSASEDILSNNSDQKNIDAAHGRLRLTTDDKKYK